jgi:carbon-monoxide dehydrogenase medium subunit
MKAGKLYYHFVENMNDALALNLSFAGNARYIAGGQSLVPMMNLRLVLNEELIDISQVPDLLKSYSIEDEFFIGAGITHSQIEDGKIEDHTQGYLQYVAQGIAYRAIRNKGTIGGSLVNADPSADWPTAMLALGAKAIIMNQHHERQVPLANFQNGLMQTCLEESDILRGVLIPKLSSNARWSYLKFCHKVGEFAHSIAAIVIDPSLGISNIVLGAAGDKPIFLPNLSAKFSKAFIGNEGFNNELKELLEEDLIQLTTHDKLSYEFNLHQSMIKRAVMGVLQ